MDDASDWINLGMLLIAVAAALFAWRQAVEAKRSRTGAETALTEARRAADASERQAVAAEKAVAIQEQQAKPKPWTAKHVSGDVYAFVNSLTEVLRVHRVEVFPERSQVGRLRLAEDGLYQPGDRLEFMYSKKFPNAPHKLVLHWSHVGDDEQHQFILPL